jgi:hypothetical protein
MELTLIALVLGYTVALFIASRFYNRLLHTVNIVRFNPPEGFPLESSERDAMLVRFLRTEPKIQRETWKAQAKPWWLLAWLTGCPILVAAVLNPPLAIGGFLCVIGLVAFIRSRRRRETELPISPGLHFDMRRKFFAVME